MNHIMTIGTYPPTKLTALAELFFSKDKPVYPEFLQKIHNWGAPMFGGNYRTIAVYECPEDKLYQGMLALAKRYHFYAQIEGYTYEILPLTNEADGIKIAQGK